MTTENKKKTLQLAYLLALGEFNNQPSEFKLQQVVQHRQRFLGFLGNIDDVQFS